MDLADRIAETLVSLPRKRVGEAIAFVGGRRLQDALLGPSFRGVGGLDARGDLPTAFADAFGVCVAAGSPADIMLPYSAFVGEMPDRISLPRLPGCIREPLAGIPAGLPDAKRPKGWPADIDAEFRSGDSWAIELRFHPRCWWSAEAATAVSESLAACMQGHYPDPVTWLTEYRQSGFREVLGLPSLGARLRFAEAVADREAGRSVSFFERSAVADVVLSIRQTLAGIPGGLAGNDEDGWPAWWSAAASDVADLLDAVPPGVLESAEHVVLSIPRAAS